MDVHKSGSILFHLVALNTIILKNDLLLEIFVQCALSKSRSIRIAAIALFSLILRHRHLSNVMFVKVFQ